MSPDFAVTFADSAHALHCFRQQHHTALALRLLPMEIPTAEALRLPDIIIQQAEKPRGLVIVTDHLPAKFHTGGTDRPRQPYCGTPYIITLKTRSSMYNLRAFAQ